VILGSIFGLIGWISMRIQLTWVGLLTFLGLVISACANRTPSSAIRTGAPWAQDLNAPPPGREPVNGEVPRIKADLNAARERQSR
jgi:hypothetical protein